MRGQVLAFDPSVDGIARDAQVFGGLFDGYPGLGHGMLWMLEIGWHTVVPNSKDLNLTGSFQRLSDVLGFHIEQHILCALDHRP